MIENIIFTINTVLPIFVTIVIGYIVKRRGILTDKSTKELNQLVFKVMLPLTLFSNIVNTDLSEILDVNLILYTSLVTILVFLFSWLYAELFIKDKSLIGTFVQGAFRGNYALLALILILNVMGDVAAAKASMVAPFVMLIYNVFSVVILTIRGKTPSKMNRESIKNTIINIGKNPIIVAVLLAIVFSALKIKIPTLINNSFNFIGGATSPIALLSIGASFSFTKVKKNISESVIAVFIKIILSPVLFMYIAYLLGFGNQEIVIIGLILGSPTAVSSYIMASSLDGDSDLAANILVLTTLFSVFTLTSIVAISKIIGLI